MKKTVILITIILAFTLSCVAQEQTTPTHLKFKNGLSTDSIGSYTGDSLIIDGEGLLKFHDDITGAKTLAELATGGDVSKVGTPVDNQVGVWTGDGTLEGTTDFTYDAIMLNIGIPDASPLMRIRGSSTPGYTIYSDANVSTWVETFNNSAGTSHLNYNERGGGTYAAQAAAPTDAIVTRHQYNVHDGTSSVKAGEFEFQVDGAVVTADFDTKYTWDLKEGASASTQKMSLDNSGLNVSDGFNITTLANDNAETNLLAYDTGTGLVTYRSVASIGGGSSDNIFDWDVGNNWYAPYSDANKADGLFYRYTSTEPTNDSALAYDGRFFATGIRAKGHADFNAIQGTSSSASNASGHFTSTVGGRVAYFIQSGVGSIRDNITIIRSQSTGTVSGNIIYINDTPTATVNGGSLLLAYGDNYELNFNPRVANSASAVAYSFDTENNLTTVGAKLLSLENQGSEKFYIDKDGAIYQLPISHSLTDSTPTDAEIDAATGTTPSVAGSGWQRLILDSDGSALMYIIVSDGSNWQYTAMTIAL